MGYVAGCSCDSDEPHAQALYEQLTAAGCRVWWDKVCLQTGVSWKDGFCAGMMNSRVFVCLVSKEAIHHPEKEWQNFSKLTSGSNCDNVYLEHRLALELRAFGLLEKIVPVLIGEEVAGSTVRTLTKYEFVSPPMLPSVCVEAVEAEVWQCMDRQALGTPLQPNRTVASVFSELLGNQGLFLEG